MDATAYNNMQVVKFTIRHILRDCFEMSLHDLETRFLAHTGHSLPFQQFGHPSSLSFLESLTDTVRVILNRNRYGNVNVRLVYFWENQCMLQSQPTRPNFPAPQMLQYRYQSYNQWTVQSAPQTPYSSPQLRRQVYQHCLVNLKNDQTLIDEITQRVLSKISEQIKLQILGANACTSTASIEGAVKRAIDQEMNEIEQNHDEKDAEMPVDNRNCDKSTKETGRESKKCKIDIVESAGDKILADPVQTSAKDDEIEDCKKVVQELLPTVTESTKKVIQIISNVLVQEKDPDTTEITKTNLCEKSHNADLKLKEVNSISEALKTEADPKKDPRASTSKFSFRSTKERPKSIKEMNERRIKSNALKLTTTNDSTDWEAEMIPNQIPVNNPFLAAIIIANPAINSKTAVPPKVPPRSLESFKSQNTAVTTLSSDHIKSVDLTLDDNKSIDLTLDNIESVDLTLDDDPEKFLKNFTLNETGNFIVKAKLPLALQKESPETFFQSFVKPVQKADDDVIEIQPVKSKKRVRFCMESENPPALAQTILDKEFISVMQTIELDLESDDSEKYVMVNENFFDPTKDPMPGLDKNDPILWSGFPKFCMMGRKIMDNNYTSSCHIELERQGQFKILVAEVSSPSRFWFHYDDCACYLDEMMVNINNYYRKKVKPEELLMPSSYHKPGMLCAGKISGEWTRGEIVYKTRTYIKVFFFDYGTNAYLAENDVKFLLEIFTELPKQAIRGCLSNVRPVGGGRLWDLKITEKFLRMVTDTVIWAKVVRLMTDNTLEIVIVDTNQKLCNLQNLSNLLVTKGLAEFHLSFEQLEQKVENFGPYCQHYPSFELLETSNYPSYSDRWYALHEKGLDLNFLEETNFITLSSDKALTDPAIQKMLKLPEMKEIRESLIFNGVLSKEQE